MAKKNYYDQQELWKRWTFYLEKKCKETRIAYYDKNIIGQICRKVRLSPVIYSGKCGIISEKRFVRICIFPVVISQENLWRTWCMRHREILF